MADAPQIPTSMPPPPGDTADTDNLAGMLAESMSGARLGDPAPQPAPVLEKPAGTPAPKLDAEPDDALPPGEEPIEQEQAPVDPMAAMLARLERQDAELAALKAERSQSPVEFQRVQAELERLNQERAQEKVAAEQAQRNDLIKTLRALRVDAIERQDPVAAERFAEQLDDAKRERDQATILAKLQPQKPAQPTFDEQVTQRFMAEERDWRVKNAVYDAREYQAVIAMNDSLRLNPEFASKPYKDVWDAALSKVRGVSKSPPARPRPVFAPVEGGGHRPPPTQVKSKLTAEQRRVASHFEKFGVGEDAWKGA